MTLKVGASFSAWLLLLAALMGCALDYEKEQTTPADQVPLMAFEQLKQTGIKDGRLLYTMESAKAEVFLVRKQMLLNRFQFQEYDSQGLEASRGEAEAAQIDTSTNDAKISGLLKVYSEAQGVTLEVDGGSSGGLTWANENRILKTEPNTAVRMSKDDGSTIDARAMTLDLGSNRLELEEGIQGTWTPETNDDAKTSPPAPFGPDSTP